MASRTQMRLAQLTGSFGNLPGQITDLRPEQPAAQAANAAALIMSSGSLLGPLAEMASAIKRIHGGPQFAAASPGKFFTNLTFDDGNKSVGDSANNAAAVHTAAVTGKGALAISAATAAGDISITSAHTAGQAILISANADAGSILDVNAGIMDVDVQGAYTLDATGVTFTSDAAVNITAVAYDVDASGVVGIDSDGAMTLGGASIGATADAAGGMQLVTSNAAGELVLQSAHTAGRALHIDADAHAGSIVDIDAGILQIDAAGIAGINSAGTLSLGTANSGVAVNIGHGTSMVTIGDDLTVVGDLTVSGETVTINTTQLLVEDDLITVSKGNDTLANANGSGLEIECTDGATANIHWKYLNAKTALSTNVDIDVDSGKVFRINGVETLNATGLGSAVVDSSLTSLGTQGETLVMGTNDISGAGAIGAASLTASGIVTAAGLTVGSAVLIEAELEMIDGITAGTAAASKAMVLDASLDISGGRNLTISGELDAATGDFSGGVDVGGVLSIGGVNITATPAEINLLDAGLTTAAVAINDLDNILLWDDSDGDVAKKIKAESLKGYVAGFVTKATNTLAAVLAAGAPWDVSRADMSVPSPQFIADNGAGTELYVNGQLLLKGVFNANPLLSTGDYFQDSGALKFAFGLEIDDVVQMVSRV